MGRTGQERNVSFVRDDLFVSWRGGPPYKRSGHGPCAHGYAPRRSIGATRIARAIRPRLVSRPPSDGLPIRDCDPFDDHC
jgi:hypothetical protein